MIYRDFHTHTTYCDGDDTPEQIVLAAIERGMDTIGFSGHSYVSFDEGCCMSRKGTVEYKAEIARLKAKYADKIRVLCGVEQDYYSLEPTDGYDYVIGSVHYFKMNDEYATLDLSDDILRAVIDRYFGGDCYALAEHYYRLVGNVVESTGADIIGHFDLITKFDERCHIFDVTNERYVSAWQAAVDKLLPYGKPFEINTGAISRGYRTEPYPHMDIIDYIKAKGGRLILSSDSHSADRLCHCFDRYAAYATVKDIK